MARPGRWIYGDTEMVFTSVGVQAVDILQGLAAVGSTVRRIIGRVDVFLNAPYNSTPNYVMRMAVHQLGAAAGVNTATANANQNRYPWYHSMGLYTETFHELPNRYRMVRTVEFDVDGDRKLTASNPTLRLAVQPSGVPRFDGYFVVTAFTRVFISFPL
jgi:hypothetical protein